MVVQAETQGCKLATQKGPSSWWCLAGAEGKDVQHGGKGRGISLLSGRGGMGGCRKGHRESKGSIVQTQRRSLDCSNAEGTVQ